MSYNKEKAREYYLKNRDKILAKQRDRDKSKKKLEQVKKWQKENYHVEDSELKKYHQDYYQNNREHLIILQDVRLLTSRLKLLELKGINYDSPNVKGKKKYVAEYMLLILKLDKLISNKELASILNMHPDKMSNLKDNFKRKLRKFYQELSEFFEEI